MDLGAGTGVHALELQRRGIPVVAVENSRTLVRIAGERGVERPVRADFRYWAGARFDTALMLMNGVGPTATLDGLRRFLLHAHRLLAPGGKLLLDSAEALQGPERAPAPSAAWPPAGGYRGQAWIELSLGDEVGRPFRELYADMDTLARTAHDAGWRTDIAFEDEQGGYLARLTRI